MTVSGNVSLDRTVVNASIIVDQVGQDIPIYAGCASALVFPAANAAVVHNVKCARHFAARTALAMSDLRPPSVRSKPNTPQLGLCDLPMLHPAS